MPDLNNGSKIHRDLVEEWEALQSIATERGIEFHSSLTTEELMQYDHRSLAKLVKSLDRLLHIPK